MKPVDLSPSKVTRDMFDAGLVKNFRSNVEKYYGKLNRLNQKLALDTELFFQNDIKLLNRPCPICRADSDQNNTLFSKRGFTVLECKVCDFVYTNFIVSHKDDAILYNNDGNNVVCAELHKNQHYAHLKLTKCRYVLQEITKYSPSSRSILDIGCFDGSLLKIAEEQGWYAVGVDLNERAIASARETGLKAFNYKLPEDNHKLGRQFSALVLLDVFEHVMEPVAFLSALKPLLKNDGVIAIQVPNFESLLVQLEGSSNKNFCHGHHSHFTQRSLERVVELSGFKICKIETYITEIDKINNYDSEQIDRLIKKLRGKKTEQPRNLTTEWIHDHFLGYKLFAIITPSPR